MCFDINVFRECMNRNYDVSHPNGEHLHVFSIDVKSIPFIAFSCLLKSILVRPVNGLNIWMFAIVIVRHPFSLFSLVI